MKSVVLISLTLKCYVNLLSWGRNAEEQVSHYAAWEWDNEEHRICVTNAVKTPNKIWNVSVAYNETNHLLKPTQNSTTMFYGDVKITVNMIVTVPRWAYQFSLRIALNIFVLVLRIWLVNQDNIPSRAMISFILIINLLSKVSIYWGEMIFSSLLGLVRVRFPKPLNYASFACSFPNNC